MILKQAKFFSWLIAILCIVSTITINVYPRSVYLFYFHPDLIKEGELWRLISPCFIHFSMLGNPFLHIIFNLTMWFYFAVAIENLEKSWKLPLLFFITAIVSNFAAFWAYGYSFGGLSGVIFGLVGYFSVFNYFSKLYYKIIPTQLLVFSIAYMIICFTGLLGNVANMAHLGGFLAGGIFGLLLR